MIDRDRFLAAIEKLVMGPLREALGFTVEAAVPFYRGIAGYLINVPMMWIRYTRFPLLFVAFDRQNPDILTDINNRVQASKNNSYFAVLVVVPTATTTGNEAEELRRRVKDSPYRNDFVVLDQQHLSRIVVSHNSIDRLIETILQQGIEMSTLSPYIVKGPVPPNMFFGREAEIKTISQSIQQTNFALVGGRRIGKSSILQRLEYLWNKDHRYQAIYVNCEGFSSADEFLSEVALKLGEKGRDYDPGISSPGLQFRRIVERIETRSEGHQIVLLLDEIDELLSADAQGGSSGQLFKTFRALAHERQMFFVFSGSRALYTALHDAGSPFFNFCQDIALKPLTDRSVGEIVTRPMRQLGIQLYDEETLINGIINLTSCHPSLVQWLCHQLLCSATTRRITSKALEEIGRSHEYYKYFLETAWGDATVLEKLVSLLPEQESFSLEDLYGVAARYGLKNKLAIRHALEILDLFALIRRDGKQYRFVLTQYPGIVRKAEDVSSLIEDLLSRVEA